MGISTLTIKVEVRARGLAVVRTAAAVVTLLARIGLPRRPLVSGMNRLLRVVPVVEVRVADCGWQRVDVSQHLRVSGIRTGV